MKLLILIKIIIFALAMIKLNPISLSNNTDI